MQIKISENGKIQPIFLLIAIFPVGVVSLGILLVSRKQSYTHQSQGSQATKTCPEAIDDARGLIALNSGQVEEFRSGEMDPKAVNPFPFNEYATFSLSGTEGTGRFMNADDVQLEIARNILESCDKTTKVTFGVNRSDYIITWFRMQNGSVQKGVCREPNRNMNPNELPWGEYICL